MIGRTIAHYEITGKLGAGGMGEVYRARDTRLDREVALKVLPAPFVEDPEQLARFRREAKMLAALNHPNVATIYGVDEVDGIHFLTLELVPGETLRERLRGGPISVGEAIGIARQIAAGLGAAHETGIIHRDLKPDNVIVRPDGSVKILDFGLAKQADLGDGKGSPALTTAYQVMGTPGYLSPEQARGEEAGRKADVWAFGCILYECLCGQRAFPGETVSERIQAMFERAPDFDAIPEQTPPTVRLLVSRCIARESSDRLDSIRDVKLLLDGALGEESRTSGIRPLPLRPGARWWPRIAVAGGVVLVGVLGLLASRTNDLPPATTIKTTLALPIGGHLGWRETSAALSKLGRGSPLLAISPDGSRVAYCVETGDESSIHVHASGELEPRPLRGTEEGRGPFFSPDGEFLAFQSNKTLKLVRVDGSEPARDVCEVVSANFSGCFSPDGKRIVYSESDGLRVVPIDGGDPRPLTERDVVGGEVEHLHPFMLDDDRVIFTVATGTGSRIAIFSESTGEKRVVSREGSSPRIAGESLLYAHEGAIRAVAFPPGSSEAARTILSGVYATPGSGGGSVTAHYDVSRKGDLLYAPAPSSEPTSAAYWVERNSEGRGREIHSGPGIWKHPRLAPDASFFVVDVLDAAGRKDVMKYEFERQLPSQLTTDGMSIVSTWTEEGRMTLRHTHFPRIRLGTDAILPANFGLQDTVYADCWTGDTLILTIRNRAGFSIWTFRRGDAEPSLAVEDEYTARFGQISPDGRWLAYVARDKQDAPLEVFVRPFGPAGVGPREKVSRDGGGEPVWSKDGEEVFFRKSDGRTFAVRVETTPQLRLGPPVLLFSNDYDPEPGGHQHYDVDRRDRFLMIKNVRVVPDRVYIVTGKFDPSGERR